MIILIIILVLAVVVGNIMLLKHTAKLDMKKFNQDPIKKAEDNLKKQSREDDKPSNN